MHALLMRKLLMRKLLMRGLLVAVMRGRGLLVMRSSTSHRRRRPPPPRRFTLSIACRQPESSPAGLTIRLPSTRLPSRSRVAPAIIIIIIIIICSRRRPLRFTSPLPRRFVCRIAPVHTPYPIRFRCQKHTRAVRFRAPSPSLARRLLLRPTASWCRPSHREVSLSWQG